MFSLFTFFVCCIIGYVINFSRKSLKKNKNKETRMSEEQQQQQQQQPAPSQVSQEQQQQELQQPAPSQVPQEQQQLTPQNNQELQDQEQKTLPKNATTVETSVEQENNQAPSAPQESNNIENDTSVTMDDKKDAAPEATSEEDNTNPNELTGANSDEPKKVENVNAAITTESSTKESENKTSPPETVAVEPTAAVTPQPQPQIIQQQQQQSQGEAPQPPRDVSPSVQERHTINIVRVSKATTEEGLRQFFSIYGTVLDVAIKDGHPLNYAFVSFATKDAADRALSDGRSGKIILDGLMLETRNAILKAQRGHRPMPGAAPLRGNRLFIGGLSERMTQGK